MPVAVVFGFLTDFAIWSIEAVPVGGYVSQWILCLVGIVLVGIGVSLEVEAGFVVIAGEGLVLAVTKAFGTPFGNTKVAFDVTLVLFAVLLSWFFLGNVQGVREGTLAAALLVGQISKLCLRHYSRLGQWLAA